MLCPRCNNMLPDNSVACNFCGYSFKAIQPQSVQKEYKKTFCIVSMIINIIACMIMGISIFPPLYIASDAFNTLSENVYSSSYELFFYMLVFCIIILGFSFSFRYFIKLFAIIRLVVSLFFFVVVIYIANTAIEGFKESIDMSSVSGNLNVDYGVGFYLMLIGVVLCIISAIICLVIPSNK